MTFELTDYERGKFRAYLRDTISHLSECDDEEIYHRFRHVRHIKRIIDAHKLVLSLLENFEEPR